MIDLSKYEGHTPGPVTRIVSLVGCDAYFVNGVDEQLFHDAPLLLEELKHTRAELEEVVEYIHRHICDSCKEQHGFTMGWCNQCNIKAFLVKHEHKE